MKIRYGCAFCDRWFDSQEECLQCELKGVDKTQPIGLIFNTAFSGKNLVFAIVKIRPFHHHFTYTLHATRDTEAGDNRWGEYCSAESYEQLLPPNKTVKAYKRMVRDLKKHGIKPIPLAKKFVYKQS